MRWRLRPRPRWGSLQHSPPLSWLTWKCSGFKMGCSDTFLFRAHENKIRGNIGSWIKLDHGTLYVTALLYMISWLNPATRIKCGTITPARASYCLFSKTRSITLVFTSFQECNELMQLRGVRRLSVRMSVNFCANRFFSQTNGRIATKLAHDGLQVSLHPGCSQGQGQRSHDTRTFLDSWNELLRH